MARLSRSALNVVGTLTLTLLSAAFLFAQVSDGGVQTNSADPFREALERRSRETALRSVTMIGTHTSDPRLQRALIAQMNEDFKQLQVIRLGMVKDIADGKSFQYKRLASDASEIKKRAQRLRSSLALLEDKDAGKTTEKDAGYDARTIQDAASDLCLQISRFTTNPLFNPGAVYNLRYATEADQALDTVITLSVNIKNSAEKLRRSN
jgi:hypothetical protein